MELGAVFWRKILTAGFIGVLLLIDGYYSENASRCASGETGESLVIVNYSYQGLTNIPQAIARDFPESGYFGVDFSYNQLRCLKRSDLEGFQSSLSMNFSHNQLTTIDSGSFLRFSRLKCLDLSHNRLNLSRQMYGSLLHPLVHLEVLRLEDNTDGDGSAFPEGFWSSSTSLSVLSIDMYPHMTFGPEYENLNLSVLSSGASRNGCNIRRISNDTFSIFQNMQLKELHLVNCYISAIDKSAFSPLRRSLKVLDLSFNRRLGMNSAQNSLYGLQNINMSRISFVRVNGVTSKPENFWLTHSNTRFLSTICVQILDISMNFFNYVDLVDQPFGRAACLKTLTMNGHSFHYFPVQNLLKWTFTYTNMIALDLSRPLFSDTVHGDVFKNVNTEVDRKCNKLHSRVNMNCKYQRSLRATDTNEISLFRKQPVSNITFPLFRHLILLNVRHVFNRVDFSGYSVRILNAKQLRELDFSDNHLESCDTRISGVENLEYLIIDGANCRRLSRNLFDSFPALIKLSFRNSGLNKFASDSNMGDIFSSIVHLREIDLSDNGLTALSPKLFEKNTALEAIYLRENKLFSVPLSVHSLKKLQSISLAYNAISHFSKRDTDLFESLSTHRDGGTEHLVGRDNFPRLIELEGNPLQCDCETIDFLDWILTTDTRLDHNGNYSCTLSNGSIVYTKDFQSRLKNLQVECVSAFWLQFTAASGAFMGLIIITAIVAYRFRWNIRYWFYRRCTKPEDYHKLEEMRYKYDAFVAYNRMDLDWVDDNLLVKVENEFLLRLCVHQRDFLVGEYIAHNIAQAVHHSRRVILILSRNFLSSDWGKFEIELAKMKMVQEDRSNIIIAILLEPIQTRDMPGSLKGLWHKITFLEWLNSPPAQRDFWERLKVAMESDN